MADGCDGYLGMATLSGATDYVTVRVVLMSGQDRAGIPIAQTDRVLSTSILECRVSISGITIMIWGSIPHIST